MCSYVHALCVLIEKEGMKVGEKGSRERYIDRCVDETIVFEFSGWTHPPLSQSLTFILCVCVFVLLYVQTVEVLWTVSLFLSLSHTFFLFHPAPLFKVMLISSPIAHFQTHTHAHTHLLTFQHSKMPQRVHIMIACIIFWWEMCLPHLDESLLTALINAGELMDQVEEIIEITHLHFTPSVPQI